MIYSNNHIFIPTVDPVTVKQTPGGIAFYAPKDFFDFLTITIPGADAEKVAEVVKLLNEIMETRK